MFSCECVTQDAKAAASEVGAVRLQFSGTTLGSSFKSERAWHDLVLFGRKSPRRRVGLIFGEKPGNAILVDRDPRIS